MPLILAILFSLNLLGQTRVPGPGGGFVPPPTNAWNFNDCSGTAIAAQVGAINGTIAGGVLNTDYEWINDSGNCSLHFITANSTLTFSTLFDAIAIRTFIWWQKITSASTAGNRRIFNKDGTTVQAWQMQALSTTALRIVFRNAADSANETWDTADGAYTLDTWQCRAVVINCPDLDAAQCGEFHDETGAVITTTQTGTNQTGARLTTSGKTMRFANGSQGTVGMIGSLDGVKVFSGALTNAQIGNRCSVGRP